VKDENNTHQLVRLAYADVARKQSVSRGSCRACCDAKPYTVPDHPVPEAELGVSCGNPLAFGHVNAGDIVLDLGSGAGKDVFLAAQKVGAEGRAIGVDMTPEMLALARENAAKFTATTSLTNVEFREGHIERLPIEDTSIDLVISNCVINLSPDKPQVFREVFRVLKPGGRMIVSDIVLNHPLPEAFRSDGGLYASCITGALQREDYLQAIRDAGFETVTILDDTPYQASRIYDDPTTANKDDDLVGITASVSVMAVRPAATCRPRGTCCSSGTATAAPVLSCSGKTTTREMDWLIDAEAMASAAHDYFMLVARCCGESLLLAGSEALGIESELFPDIALGLGGGMGLQGHICGAVSGASMVISLAVLQKEPNDYSTRQGMTFSAVGRLCRAVENRLGSVACQQLCGLDLTTDEGFQQLIAGVKAAKCAVVVKEVARILAAELQLLAAA
jgi:arsenite methyltransferase